MLFRFRETGRTELRVGNQSDRFPRKTSTRRVNASDGEEKYCIARGKSHLLLVLFRSLIQTP